MPVHTSSGEAESGTSKDYWFERDDASAEGEKEDPKSEKGISVGYCEDTKGYRVYDPVNDCFNVNRDVVVLSEGVILHVPAKRAEKVEFMEILNEYIEHPGAVAFPEILAIAEHLEKLSQTTVIAKSSKMPVPTLRSHCN